jgi:hypothetical protein
VLPIPSAFKPNGLAYTDDTSNYAKTLPECFTYVIETLFLAPLATTPDDRPARYGRTLA